MKPERRPEKKKSNDITSVCDESVYLRVSMCMHVWTNLGLCNRIEK